MGDVVAAQHILARGLRERLNACATPRASAGILGLEAGEYVNQATQVSVGPVPWPQEESIAMSEPSKLAPLFVAPPPEADTPFDLPGDAPLPPLTDDIPEVPVPGPVLAALASEAPPPPQDTALLVDATTRLLEGKITDWVQTQSTATMRVLDQVYGHVAACLDKIAVANDHAQYQLATALDRLGEQGVSVHPTPYVATLQALSPQGFPLTLTLRKRSAEELVMALEQLGQWLHQQGYFTPTGTVANDERLPF